jgi:hypothetical protein
MEEKIPESIENIEIFRFKKEANAYYKTAIGGLRRKNIFTNEILYNIISMSIEKYIMAFLFARKYLPACHTLGGLIKDLKKFIPVEESLEKKVAQFDNLQFICALTFFSPEPISDADITDMVLVLQQIKELVQMDTV